MRPARWAVPALGVSMLVLATLPNAAATPPASVLVPPFPAAHWNTGNTTTLTGCGSASWVPPRSWNSTSGQYVMGAKAHSTACPSGKSSFALEALVIGVAIPITFRTTGIHQVLVTWNLTASTNVSTTAGSCTAGSSGGDCFQAAHTDIFGSIELDDALNHTFLRSGSSWTKDRFTSFDTYCMSSSCVVSTTSGGTGPGAVATSSLNYSVIAHHHYAVELYLTIEAYTYDSVNAATSSGSSARASVLPIGAAGIAQVASVQLS